MVHCPSRRLASRQVGKSPLEYQLVRENTDFAWAAGKYIEHSKLLAPTWTAGCELALLFPEMKIVAPRAVGLYFTNAGNPGEGVLRGYAQLCRERPLRKSQTASMVRAEISRGNRNRSRKCCRRAQIRKPERLGDAQIDNPPAGIVFWREGAWC